MNDKLSNSILRKMLKYDKENNLIKNHESKSIEFKESFVFASKKDYFKTMASFANANGGYLIFGVKDKPKTVVGLKDSRFEEFNDLKSEQFTMELNSFFSPEIVWDTTIYEISENLKLGIMYIPEAETKPIICKKKYDSKDKKYNIIEGDIYYRYYGQNSKIHFEELVLLLNKEKEKESKKWLEFFSKATKIGVDNVGLLNYNTGVFSKDQHAVILDDELLNKFKFIKEGEFDEKKGMPTLNVVGNIELKQGNIIIGPKKERVKGIRISDIFMDFLENNKVYTPEEYIKQICFEATGNLPVYYYISLSKCNVKTIIEIIEKVVSRSQSKNILLKRLQSNNVKQVKCKNTDSESYINKKKIIDEIMNYTLSENIKNYDEKRILDAILIMERTQIIKSQQYLLRIMKNLYNVYYEYDSIFASKYRNALCWIDEALYKNIN